MWKFEDMMKYSKQLAKDIFSGKITIEEAVIKDFEQTGISKDKARKILNELLSNSANRRPIKSGYSNNPDYFGDWYGKGQIDFNAIINPEDDGDIWMVKMWSGAGYVLDVYLCKATNMYDAMDIVFNWSYEHEGANNIVFDYDYLMNECRENFEKYPDYFGDDLSGDYEEFEMRWFEDYVSNDDYNLFARSENFFIDKVPENVLAENQGPIENSRKVIKSGLMTPTLSDCAKATYDGIKQMLDAIDDGMEWHNGNALQCVINLDTPVDEALLPYGFIIWKFRHKDGTPWTESELDELLDENNAFLV